MKSIFAIAVAGLLLGAASPSPSVSPTQASEVDLLPKASVMDPVDQLVARFWAPPLLQELLDMPYLKVGTPENEKREMKQGEEFKMGDRFQTSSEGAMRILFLDGAQALVGSNTALALDFEEAATEKTEEDIVPIRTPMVFLLSGDIRFLVPEKKSMLRNAGMKSGAHVFIVQTRFGAIGVRGTDFVVSVNEDGLRVYCFSGAVEVAKNYKDLKKFKGVIVNPRQRSEVKKLGQAPSQPANITPTEILSGLDKLQPKIHALWVASTSQEGAVHYAAFVQDRMDKKLDALAKEVGIPLFEIHKRTGRRAPPAPNLAGKASAPNPVAETDANLKAPNRRKAREGTVPSAQEMYLGRKWTKITGQGMTIQVPEPPGLQAVRSARLDPQIAVIPPEVENVRIPARPVPQGATPAYPWHEKLED
ncbi:MAG: FecR domain-containing protein [Bdellovibrionales bacterium]|nr:FecR domain-containing protein [Bdellovibrionales bacterium]